MILPIETLYPGTSYIITGNSLEGPIPYNIKTLVDQTWQVPTDGTKIMMTASIGYATGIAGSQEYFTLTPDIINVLTGKRRDYSRSLFTLHTNTAGIVQLPKNGSRITTEIIVYA